MSQWLKCQRGWKPQCNSDSVLTDVIRVKTKIKAFWPNIIFRGSCFPCFPSCKPNTEQWEKKKTPHQKTFLLSAPETVLPRWEKALYHWLSGGPAASCGCKQHTFSSCWWSIYFILPRCYSCELTALCVHMASCPESALTQSPMGC